MFLPLLLYFLLPTASWPSSNLPPSIEAECKVKLNKETLQNHENKLDFLNSVPGSMCLQSQQTAIKLNITGFQSEKEKQWSYLGALKKIINAVKQPTQEKLLGLPSPQHSCQGGEQSDEGISNLWGLWERGGDRGVVNSSELPGQGSQKLSAWPVIIKATWK